MVTHLTNFKAFATFLIRPSSAQCRSKGNISGGGGHASAGGASEPLEGSGGMLPKEIFKSRGLEMPFPAFSKSYL